MKFISKSLIVALSLSFLSCSNDDDTATNETTNPEITSVKLNTTEMINNNSEIEVTEDDSLSFTIVTSDNEALSQLSINVHYGEGHEHEGHDHRSKKSDEPQMSFQKIFELSGTSETSYIKFADNLHYEAAEYHLELALLDVQGNRTEAVYEFHLEDEEHDHEGEAHEHEGEEHNHEGEAHEHEGEEHDHEGENNEI